MKRGWQEGEVALDREHIVITLCENDDDDEVSVARLAPAAVAGSFRVQFVLGSEHPRRVEIIESVIRSLDYYLVVKDEDDPWAYAIYHCSSAGNAYRELRWGYWPEGERG